MSYQELKKNNGEETEILSHEHEKVRGLCCGLKRVNAPKNFDFHLKARIAASNKNDFQQNAFLPFLRYALPLSLVLLIAGFVVFSGILTNDKSATLAEVSPTQTSNAPINSEKTVVVITPTIVSNVVSPANVEISKTISNIQTAALTNKSGVAVSANKNSVLRNEDFGGTRESTSRDSLILTPSGIPSVANMRGRQSNVSEKTIPLSVKSVLSGVGIEADFVGSGWNVKMVKANSLAARSGIKTGDVIESADDKKLNTETILEQTFSFKTLYVLREGKRIAVELR